MVDGTDDVGALPVEEHDVAGPRVFFDVRRGTGPPPVDLPEILGVRHGVSAVTAREHGVVAAVPCPIGDGGVAPCEVALIRTAVALCVPTLNDVRLAYP